MPYIVSSRDLKWRGQRLLKGARIPVDTDREHNQADLLVKIGKAEQAPDRKAAPVREADTPPPAPKAEEEEAPAPAAPAKSPPPKTGRYNTRRLKARR